MIKFLRHVIPKGEVRIDWVKMTVILDWSAPFKVLELRDFLGLANYYPHFIEEYSRKVTPIIDLLSKYQPWG